jgi:hypothetical protein
MIQHKVISKLSELSSSLKLVLILLRNILKQKTHALRVMDASDGFGQKNRNINRLDLHTLQLLVVMGKCVRHDHLVNVGALNNKNYVRKTKSCPTQRKTKYLLQQIWRIRAHQPMSTKNINFTSAFQFQRLRRGHKSARIINHVIHHNSNLPIHVSHDVERRLLLFYPTWHANNSDVHNSGLDLTWAS